MRQGKTANSSRWKETDGQQKLNTHASLGRSTKESSVAERAGDLGGPVDWMVAPPGVDFPMGRVFIAETRRRSEF